MAMAMRTIRHRAERGPIDFARARRSPPTPPQISNGDEARYPNFIGNYSQGLPHNSIGEVDPAAYHSVDSRRQRQSE